MYTPTIRIQTATRVLKKIASLEPPSRPYVYTFILVFLSLGARGGGGFVVFGS